MKQICLYCNRTSSDRNLWCQETYCKAELSPIVLNYGEEIGDIQIIKPLLVLRSSVLYKARQGETTILLKIAHPGYHEQLQREARYLMDLRQGTTPGTARRGRNNQDPLQRLTQQYPMMPVLLPPHRGESLRDYFYGKTVFHGETLYYTIFQYIEGESLRALLLKNPQPWFQHVSQVMVALTDAVALMHHHKVFHLCLSPDLILVRYDKQNILRPTLVDLGIVADQQEIDRCWNSWLTPLAYRPLEVVERDRILSGHASDVYGLGAILYELLAGRPVYPFQQRSDAEIRDSILYEPVAPINRPELAGLPAIAEQAVSKDFRLRQENVKTFHGQLQHHSAWLPKEKPPRRIDWRQVAVVAGVLVAVMLLIVLALSFQA